MLGDSSPMQPMARIRHGHAMQWPARRCAQCRCHASCTSDLPQSLPCSSQSGAPLREAEAWGVVRGDLRLQGVRQLGAAPPALGVGAKAVQLVHHQGGGAAPRGPVVRVVHLHALHLQEAGGWVPQGCLGDLLRLRSVEWAENVTATAHMTCKKHLKAAERCAAAASQAHTFHMRSSMMARKLVSVTAAMAATLPACHKLRLAGAWLKWKAEHTSVVAASQRATCSRI